MMPMNPMQIFVIVTFGVVSFCSGYMLSGTSSTEVKDAADIAAEVSRLSISDTAGSPNTISDTRGFFQKLWDSLKSFFYSDEGSSTTTPGTPDSVQKKRNEAYDKFLDLYKERGGVIDKAFEKAEALKYEIMNERGWEERKDELPERPFFKEDYAAVNITAEAIKAAEAAAEARRAAEAAAEAAEVAEEVAAEAAEELARAVRLAGGGRWS